MVWDWCPDSAGILLSSFRRHFVHNHILVRFEFLRFNLVCCQEEFGIAVTRIARRVLSGLALNIVRCGRLPTGHRVWICVRDAIRFEQVRVRWYVAHENVVVRHIGGLGGILANLEIHPRGIKRAERQALGIFAHMTAGTVFVRACGVADLAREFVAVKSVLQDFAVRLDSLVAVEASRLGFVVHINAGLSVAVQ